MKKIIGWVLLVVGLVVVVLPLYYSWQIFNAKKPVPEIFELTATEEAPGKAGGGIQEQMQQMVSQEIGKLFPKEFVPKLFNLIAWSIGAAILIMGGGKIAGLGIRLLK